MNGLTQLAEIVQIARGRPTRRLAVAAAHDLQVLQAVMLGRKEGLIDPILIGDTEKIMELCESSALDLENISLIHESDPLLSCELAVQLIREGEADVLMKGLVSTAPLLKAVLNKDKGLRKSTLLSHAALFELPGYHKILGVTDAAMNMHPGLHEKVNILENALEIYQGLQVKDPKVAVLAPVEKVNPKIPSTLDAAALKKMNQAGKISGCTVDGPFALDNALSPEAARLKGLEGPVAGDADLLLVPDLDAGNILYKSLIFLAGGTAAAVIMGASVPIVLTSRADSEQSKLMSIALAAALE